MAVKQIQEAYIVAAVRTPVGKAPRGVFRYIRPDDLLAHVIKGVLNKTPQLDPALVEDVIIGCAMPEAEQGMNVARIGALLADLPDSIPGMTINRFCSSGLQTIALAIERIQLGDADVIIAGGTESMSRTPLGGYNLRPNLAYFKDNEDHIGIAYGMGITAEIVAAKYNISREVQDEFAFNSHQKAIKAQEHHEFVDEILPYTVTYAYVNPLQNTLTSTEEIISADEGPRRDTTPTLLGNLKPVFASKGSVTAGNSSQMSDGAGAVLVASERILKEFNLKPLAKLLSFAVAGVAPEIMGIGPVVAIPKALKRANLQLADIEWIELNEAFAAQSLAVIQEVELNPLMVNPLGGAIALGHPLGATGSIRAATLVHGLVRQNKKYGMVTMCIGTGMGAAGIFESCG